MPANPNTVTITNNGMVNGSIVGGDVTNKIKRGLLPGGRPYALEVRGLPEGDIPTVTPGTGRPAGAGGPPHRAWHRLRRSPAGFRRL